MSNPDTNGDIVVSPSVDLDAPAHRYDADDFAHGGQASCDLIMKGGITSGVVYPHAVCELATRYRLLDIGGSSAGAVAAVMTAAAEYERQCAQAGEPSPARADAGYLRISRLPAFFAEPGGIFRLFQPQPSLRAHFDAAIGAMRASKALDKALPVRVAKVLWPLVRNFPLPALAAMALALAPVWLMLPGSSASATAAALVLALAGGGLAALIASAAWAAWTATRRLPRSNFGLCSGLTAIRGDGPALTEWLHAEIQATAGLGPRAAPLTFGDLQRHRVGLSVITTELAQGRPYELSLAHAEEREDDEHFGAYHYLEREFRGLFPAEVVDAMLAASGEAVESRDGEPLIPWPAMAKLPVVVATRLSFGFPVLLQAIPLYRRDETLRTASSRAAFARCLLSDGGISSNLPIHFFDGAFPDRPTFAISLERHREARHGSDPRGRVAMFTGGPDDSADPLHAPLKARQRGIVVSPVSTVLEFASAVLHAAADWQDTLQSVQAGYRDRIVHVALKDHEGGLNLDISPAAVNRMINIGRLAGQRLLAFDLDAHRWRRFLSVTDMIEREFEEVRHRWRETGPAGLGAFRDFVERQAPRERYFPPPDREVDASWLADLQAFYDRLSELAEPDLPRRLTERARTPRPRTDLKARPRL